MGFFIGTFLTVACLFAIFPAPSDVLGIYGGVLLSALIVEAMSRLFDKHQSRKKHG
jgi:hypothetical protein